MGRLASSADFEGPSGLYWEPGTEQGYRRYEFFARRADLILARHGAGGKVLVVGCGWGFLVDELLARGYDAWGLDGSAYAVAKAAEVLPAASAGRVLLADAMNRSQVAAVRAAAGLSGNQRFKLVVTEDVLPVLTDAEVAIAVAECRRVASNVLHIVTPLQPDTEQVAGLNWKTGAQWKTLAAPDAVCVTGTYEVL